MNIEMKMIGAVAFLIGINIVIAWGG